MGLHVYMVVCEKRSAMKLDACEKLDDSVKLAEEFLSSLVGWGMLL